VPLYQQIVMAFNYGCVHSTLTSRELGVSSGNRQGNLSPEASYQLKPA
jgi:hypothetical protein